MPTCIEIAASRNLWGEYVAPQANDADQTFQERTYEERLALIHELWPDECNCQDNDDE